MDLDFLIRKKIARDVELTYVLLRDGHKTEPSEGMKIRGQSGNVVGIICPTIEKGLTHLQK